MEISTLLSEIEVEKKNMEDHRKKVQAYRRQFRECQANVTRKMEVVSDLEDEFMKSVTSKLSLYLY